MKRVAFIFIFLAGSTFAQLAPSNLIANIGARNTTSLNGTWRVIIDPYLTGGWARFYEARKAVGNELVEYDFDTSGTLHVPGDWNSQRDSLFFYEGSAWYKKSFSYEKKADSRVFLYFGAANYQATIYLNGQKLGEHRGGYTPFNFEVTDKLRSGENVLVAEVNNSRHADAVPGLSTDWWNFGGLTRDVAIVEVPAVFIQNYFVQLAKGSLNEIAGWVRLNGATTPQQVTLEILEANIKTAVTTDAEGYATFKIPNTKLSLWSPESPKLYDVIISTRADRVQDQVGFRSIEARGTKFFLNGKPLFLRGINIHEEAAFRGGRAVSVEDDEVLLGWARELGCNFVRLAHYPHNEAMVRLADRLGLLVWSEIPVYWGNDWNNPSTLQNAEEQLRDNIARDHNRAAVILWSIANETPGDAGRLEFLKKLIADARQLDSTRLLTAAMNHTRPAGPNTTEMNDKLGEFVDVLGWNEYLGWYNGEPKDADQAQWTTAFDKPLIMSEFGGEAAYGTHGSANVRWTEEYQASIFEHQLKSISRIPSLVGIAPWLLMDFHSPRRLLPGVQDYFNRKGVVSDKGERKKAFYVLQKFYRELPKSQK